MNKKPLGAGTMNTYNVELPAYFGAEFAALNKAQQDLVLSDFAKMLSDEYDMHSTDMDYLVMAENVHDAAREYARRIGEGNLIKYAKCLAIQS